MNTPITLTDKARTHIQSFLATLGDQAGFRFGVKKSGCSGYAYIADVAAAPKTEELCIEANGLRIFIDPASIPIIEGTTIDVVEKELGQKQLVFNNPRVADSCGCGESFTIKEGKEDA